MALIRSFRDMKVYQRSRVEAQRVFKLSQAFPRDERFSLTDQIRRSSRAVKSMVAEAWAHRRYPASFVSKLDDALDCGYITPAQHQDHDAAWQSIGGMLNNTIEKTDEFCRNAS